MWVLIVGRWMMFSPTNLFGIMKPSGYTSPRQMKESARSPTASRIGIHSSSSYRCTFLSPWASTTSTCLFSRSPSRASITTVRLWQAWMRSGSYPSRFIARITPSSCHGVVELAGKKKCQEMLTLSAVSASRATTSWYPARFMTS